ncbi:MAG: hypothetical protein JWO30_4452 [Fibrobacteres bacterium]|nr:hypothetical protein [Fibrobacterota bacterium]
MSSSEVPDSKHLLFAYGSLMLTTGIEAVDAAMHAAGASLGRAFIHARLYDLGEYPGAVPLQQDEDVEGPAEGYQADERHRALAHEDAPKVWGRLIRLRDPEAFYAVIDAYEGFDPAKPMESEFIRAETVVFLEHEDKGIVSQVYFYNHPIHGRHPIEAGDYLAFWHAKGRPAQGRIVP